MRFKVERICRTDSLSAVPMERVRFDLLASAMNLEREGIAVEKQELYLIIKMDDLDLTAYPSGRVLFHPLNDKKRATELVQRLFSMMVQE
jgi:hypothetical protein